ncbi:hypothetical protein FEM54_15105 [Pseudomonas edaphica]|uniref:Uncharacterized protein n=1 Tax=Pseudomonas edaphica TaxID=2006980 RepID=A0ABY2U4A1_9PSED|nr:hypothetical protein [Pseudomonas edaphica]TLG91004.1 hypothetical protein FEM54_15105 [Pseudomonas edaphica]
MDQPTGNVSGEYSNCRYQDHGNGLASYYVTIPFNKLAPGENTSSRHAFASRAIVLYTYNSNGIPSNSTAGSVYINDARYGIKYPSGNLMMYTNSYDWYKKDAFTAETKVTFSSSGLSKWPGIAIRTGNFSFTPQLNQETYFDAKGAVYISKTEGLNGSCRIINPETPPPQDITLNVSVPDWDFGDLQPGIVEKTLDSTKDQLCFTYNSGEIIGQKFIINTYNTHGGTDDTYRLRHFSASSYLPYSLTLNDGKNKPLKIPNNTRNTITLDSSGRTCFSPTIRANVSKTQVEGNYYDVLNFNVTTKP